MVAVIAVFTVDPALYEIARTFAPLAEQLRLTTFRHDGLTKLGNTGIADVCLFSGYTQLSISLIYNKTTMRKAKATAIYGAI
ncbi:hypothetical protein [Pedomonas mirosovicensis]|uniref:hypothetical protein n=1 Tax=Pedomonas mirosovicensis TaxID=2908641 RepID=UPI002169588A|nr:hypothetical protein [Pedomonas mirosovicensis]MCH8684809.1 hypothetical protein [Pedomonas mirosovicensis]